MVIGTPRLTGAVRELKQLFAAHHQLVDFGQFYLTNRLTVDMVGVLREELRTTLPFSFLPAAEVDRVVRDFTSLVSRNPRQIDVAAIRHLLSVVDPAGALTQTAQMFLPGPPDTAFARTSFDVVWGNDQIGSAPPYLGLPTVPRLTACYELEKSSCFKVLRSFARKVLRARGSPHVPAAAKVSQGVIGAAQVQTGVVSPLTGVTSDLVHYRNHAALPAIAGKMKATIDARCLVEFGVLSGARHEHATFPQPEHFILGFAYDLAAGRDLLAFWDPDAACSEIASTGWGRGFGQLALDGAGFSTALDPTDLVSVDVNPGSLTFGDHLTERRRHRYQIYYVQTLPL